MYERMKTTLFSRMDDAEFIQHFYDLFHAEYAKKAKKKRGLNHYPCIEKNGYSRYIYQTPIERSTFDLSTYDYYHKFANTILLNYFAIDVALLLFKNAQDSTLSTAQARASQEVVRAFIKSAIEFSAEIALSIGCEIRVDDKNISLPEKLWVNKDLKDVFSIERFYAEVCRKERIRKHMRQSVIRYMKQHRLINQQFEVMDQRAFVTNMSNLKAGALNELENLATEFLRKEKYFSDGLDAILKLIIWNTPKRRFRKVIKSYG